MTARSLETVVLAHATDELLIFVPATGEVHALNSCASAVYRLCDGRHTRAAMAEQLRRLTGLPADEGLVDFALAELTDAGVVIPDDPGLPAVETRRALLRRLNLPAESIRLLPLVETILVPTTASGCIAAAQHNPVPTHDKPDVQFAPAKLEDIDEMLALAEVTATDRVYDLGCGDGAIVIRAAEKTGCRAMGFDINPKLVEAAREEASRRGVSHLVQFERQNMFRVDLREADVVLLYLLPTLNVRLMPQFARMKPGSRIVSNDFDMKGAIPDRVVQVYSTTRHMYKTFLLWTVPLKLTNRTVRREWAQSCGFG